VRGLERFAATSWEDGQATIFTFLYDVIADDFSNRDAGINNSSTPQNGRKAKHTHTNA